MVTTVKKLIMLKQIVRTHKFGKIYNIALQSIIQLRKLEGENKSMATLKTLQSCPHRCLLKL